MKFRSLFLSIVVSLFLLLFLATDTWSWGFWAHKEIHRYALRSLPKAMKPFFEQNADSLIERSIEPDLRASSDRKVEGPYHYIDIDRYGVYPFRKLPHKYDEAVKKFGKAMVDSNGTVPWRIAQFTKELTKAMREKKKNDILFYASNLGHYIADAHVPLHSVENYDGQLTNQKGVHARWESRLTEMFGPTYTLGPEKIEFIKDPLEYAFTIVLESNKLVGQVLAMDLKAREGIPDSVLVTVIQQNGRTEYRWNERYYEQYHSLLKGMVEHRMKNSIRRVASFWYTAWVNAGKPNLSAL